MKKHVLCDGQFPGIDDFLAAMPGIFEREGVVLRRDRNTVKQMSIGGGPVIVKHYKRPDIFKKLQYAFTGKCKGNKAYHAAENYYFKGLNSPLPLACIVLTDKGILVDSYFVCHVCPGEPVTDLLHGEGPETERLIDALAQEIARMHGLGVLHRDLNASNIYYTVDDDGQYQFYYIDINRSKFDCHPTERQCAAEIMRLSSDPAVLAAFAKRYAEYRGWDPDRFGSLVQKARRRFTRRKTLLRRLKNKQP